MTKNAKRLNVFFIVLVISSAILVAVPIIYYPVIIAEVLIPFRVFVSLLFFSFFVFLALARAYWLGLAQILLVICNIWPVVSAHSFKDSTAVCAYDKQDKSLKVLSFNVYYKNENYESIFQTLNASDADIIVLQEAQPEFMKYGHDRLVVAYPFYYPEIKEGKHARWTLYSRYPIIKINSTIKNIRGVALYVQIQVNGRVVNLITTHAKSPKTLSRIETRNMRINNFGHAIREVMKENKHVIVAGDFNNVSWHPAMQAFKKHTQLRNNDMASTYFGTWPTWIPSFLSTPIDHIFYDQYFHHVSYSRKLPSGSDHYPIIADLYFCE